jgi:two-component system NtrC family sensor kinase
VRVFEPFFTSFKNGTGLGLSICERLIRHDRGSMRIESVPGSGTEVEVRYPDAG